jgi:hypothetical protein
MKRPGAGDGGPSNNSGDGHQTAGDCIRFSGLGAGGGLERHDLLYHAWRPDREDCDRGFPPVGDRFADVRSRRTAACAGPVLCGGPTHRGPGMADDLIVRRLRFITASEFDLSADKARAHGFNGYMLKPLDLDVLEKKLGDI